MAAFIPSRRDPEVNEIALAKVRDDKLRESGDGFDGTWVAHPGPRADRDRGVRRRARKPSEPARAAARRCRRQARAARRLRRPGRRDHRRRGCARTSRSGARYLDAWLHGTGAAAIDNLMEDVATAEIARSQVWSWLQAGEFDRGGCSPRARARRGRGGGEGAVRRGGARCRAARVPHPERVSAPPRRIATSPG